MMPDIVKINFMFANKVVGSVITFYITPFLYRNILHLIFSFCSIWASILYRLSLK